MFTRTRHHGVSATVAMAAASIIAAFPAAGFAQQDGSSEIEEIIVTASKRARTLQDTPIAVSVVSQQAIEQSKVLNLSDLQVLVPSLRVETFTRASDLNFSIRGFGNGGSALGTEPAVGVFIDGVFRSRPTATALDLPRLDRIEVLKGPQSTLFGKNASAGVISVVTAAPSREREDKLEVSIGNYDHRLVRGYISGAVSDTLALSLSGSINQRDGFADSNPGVDDGIGKLNEKDRWSLRAQALYEPTENVSLRVIADYTDLDENCCVTGNIFTGGTEAAIQALGGQVRSTSEDNFTYEAFINIPQDNKIKDNGISLYADIDFDGFTLTSITAFRNNERGFQDGDIDYTSLDLATGDNTRNIETISQEFRLTSTTEGPFSWMLGTYLFREDIEDGGCTTYGDSLREYVFLLLGGGLDGTGGLLGLIEGLTGNEGEFFRDDIQVCAKSSQDNEAYSLFGTIDYEFTDALTATFGLNYTEDDKEVWVIQTQNPDVWSSLDLVTLAGGAFAGLQAVQFRPPFLNIPNAVEDNKTSDDDTTWLARLTWAVNDDLNVYASAATGFKSSSWDLTTFSRPLRSNQAALEAAGLARPDTRYGTRYSLPEEATVYELGLKARFDRGYLNVAIFDQKIENFQTRIFDGVDFVQANAGQLSSEGIEFDALYAPNDSWQFTLAATYLDPIYDDFSGAPAPFGEGGAIDRSGTRPGGIHDLSATGTVVYNFAFANGMDGYLRAEYLFERDTGLSDAFPDIARQVNTANASAGLNINDKLSAQVWGRNIFNDEYYTGGFVGVAQSTTVNSFLNEPRTYGVSLSYQFH